MLGRIRFLLRDDGGPAESVEQVVDTLPEQTTTPPILDTDLIGAHGDKGSEDATRAWLASEAGQAWRAAQEGA